MRIKDLILITEKCSERIQEALNSEIPMTYELFCECSDRLVEIGAYGTAGELAKEYPEFTRRNLEELGLES